MKFSGKRIKNNFMISSESDFGLLLNEKRKRKRKYNKKIFKISSNVMLMIVVFDGYDIQH